MPSKAMLIFHEYLLRSARASSFVTSLLVAKLAGLDLCTCADRVGHKLRRSLVIGGPLLKLNGGIVLLMFNRREVAPVERARNPD